MFRRAARVSAKVQILVIMALVVLGLCLTMVVVYPEDSPGGLRLAMELSPENAVIALAADESWFLEQGLPVRILEFSSHADVWSAYEAGHADAMLCATSDLFQGRGFTGRDPRIVLVMHAPAGGGPASLLVIDQATLGRMPNALSAVRKVWQTAIRKLEDKSATLEQQLAHVTHLDSDRLRAALSKTRFFGLDEQSAALALSETDLDLRGLLAELRPDDG